jgi:hypothetical protein
VDYFPGRHSKFTLGKTNAAKRARAPCPGRRWPVKSAEGVPAENMYSHDKANLGDDPRDRTCLFKRSNNIL